MKQYFCVLSIHTEGCKKPSQTADVYNCVMDERLLTLSCDQIYST